MCVLFFYLLFIRHYGGRVRLLGIGAQKGREGVVLYERQAVHDRKSGFTFRV